MYTSSRFMFAESADGVYPYGVGAYASCLCACILIVINEMFCECRVAPGVCFSGCPLLPAALA
jgi:hypothetical protein